MIHEHNYHATEKDKVPYDLGWEFLLSQKTVF